MDQKDRMLRRQVPDGSLALFAEAMELYKKPFSSNSFKKGENNGK